MKLTVVCLCLIFSLHLSGQSGAEVINPEFSKKLESLLSHSVPELTCNKLFNNFEDYILLDTRDIEEYNVSHIKGALWVGYSGFKPALIKSLPKDKAIVCYCSVGYRSEKIAEQLYKAGYTKVFNLYGSIFEWLNQGFPVYDIFGFRVYKVHTYNKRWSRWMNNDKIQKIY